MQPDLDHLSGDTLPPPSRLGMVLRIFRVFELASGSTESSGSSGCLSGYFGSVAVVMLGAPQRHAERDVSGTKSHGGIVRGWWGQIQHHPKRLANEGAHWRAPGGGELCRPCNPRMRSTHAGIGTAQRSTRLKCLQGTLPTSKLSVARLGPKTGMRSLLGARRA